MKNLWGSNRCGTMSITQISALNYYTHQAFNNASNNRELVQKRPNKNSNLYTISDSQSLPIVNLDQSNKFYFLEFIINEGM
jgi:hypothetical protein